MYDLEFLKTFLPAAVLSEAGIHYGRQLTRDQLLSHPRLNTTIKMMIAAKTRGGNTVEVLFRFFSEHVLPKYLAIAPAKKQKTVLLASSAYRTNSSSLRAALVEETRSTTDAPAWFVQHLFQTKKPECLALSIVYLVLEEYRHEFRTSCMLREQLAEKALEYLR